MKSKMKYICVSETKTFGKQANKIFNPKRPGEGGQFDPL